MGKKVITKGRQITIKTKYIGIKRRTKQQPDCKNKLINIAIRQAGRQDQDQLHSIQVHNRFCPVGCHTRVRLEQAMQENFFKLSEKDYSRYKRQFQSGITHDERTLLQFRITGASLEHRCTTWQKTRLNMLNIDSVKYINSNICKIFIDSNPFTEKCYCLTIGSKFECTPNRD